MQAVCIILVFAGLAASQFAPFGPIPQFFLPPPPIFTVFVFPPVTLQAKAGGGLRASIPDDCGVESFEFESRKDPSNPWKGKNVTSKTGGNWIFEDPVILLTPGQTIFYRCRINQRGSYYTKPDTEWIVPELSDDFDPPKPPKKAEDCPEESAAEPDEKKEETTPNPDEEESTEEETTDNAESSTPVPDEESDEKPVTRMKPTKMKSNKPKNSSKSPNKDSEEPCPPPGPTPGETREEALERKLAKVQCDMLLLAERTYDVNQALSSELLELKKLNYAVVSRIQRLETLLRNLNRPSFPFY